MSKDDDKCDAAFSFPGGRKKKRRRLLEAWNVTSRLFACSTLLEAGVRTWASRSNVGLALLQLAAAGLIVDPKQPRFLPALGVVLWKTYMFASLWSMAFAARVLSVGATLAVLDLTSRSDDEAESEAESEAWVLRVRLLPRLLLFSAVGAFVFMELVGSDDVLLASCGVAVGCAVGNHSEALLLLLLLVYQLHRWWLLQATDLELNMSLTVAGGLMGLMGQAQFTTCFD